MSRAGDRPSFVSNYVDDAGLRCPGTIQPHGMLMWVPTLEGRIEWVSENLPHFLGISPAHLLGQPLGRLFSPATLGQIRQRFQAPGGANYCDCTTLQWSDPCAGLDRSSWDRSQTVDLSAHPASQGVILELEPALPQSTLRLTAQLQALFHQIHQACSVDELLLVAVQSLQTLTDFERVMAYRFDSQGAGEVVAEVKPTQGAIAYQGLHFPATDVPEVARRLYLQGMLRYIPDLMAPSVPLIPHHSHLLETPLDLSGASLRSVDDCCRAYHQNMGVRALLVVPIRVNRQLWGLMTCHHPQPGQVSMAQRHQVSLLGQHLSATLSTLISAETVTYQTHLKHLQTRLIQSLSESERFSEVLMQPDLKILELVRAQGAAICLGNGITLVGETPEAEEVFALLQWADPQVQEFIFHTHELPHCFPPAQAYADKASGVLLLKISETQKFSMLWFRPEVVQTVHWAENPAKAGQIPPPGQMGPRQSFARWQELIQHTAVPWQPSEVENALGLRAAISGIALRKADELAQINQELARSNEELSSFTYAASHDLKEPLRGIYNYTTFLLEDYAEVLDEAGIDRMKALLRLTRRMDQLIDALLKFSQMRQTDLNIREVDLNLVVQSVSELMRMSRPNLTFDLQIPRSLPRVRADKLLLNELFSNLISNALKYNEADLKVVEVGYVLPGEMAPYALGSIPKSSIRGKMLLYVRDNGIGIRPHHRQTIFRLFKRLHSRHRFGGGTGAGLTIVKKIVERHGGMVWVESQVGQGSTFWFTLT
ncbi:ATP-binding protein [Lyngbya confervoides]|uniref:histidine kinase n=1 Tax=Lyngbya confervoides BDU141951 TaxID=1574623 RepID=A0ABD4T1R9_9CYAN|nr:ATP-binding protein [Lyngbya confervoides]MCM1982537.1 ATP-binding protein [Lyngbya confervoides BDU141951]